MNGTYYQTATYPNELNLNTAPIGNNDFEQSYIENILRQNKGKKVKAYFSFTDSVEWKDKIFEGIIEESGKDHLILSDPRTGKWNLIQMIYLNYIEFEEPIKYNPSYIG